MRHERRKPRSLEASANSAEKLGLQMGLHCAHRASEHIDVPMRKKSANALHPMQVRLRYAPKVPEAFDRSAADPNVFSDAR